ncbi:MAG: helix-turn-helix transcriptional regulator [Oscillospiraceae bacterium]
MTGQEAIKKLLREKKKTQRELCTQVYGEGVRLVSLNRILNSSDMKLSQLIKISQALDCELILRPNGGNRKDEITIGEEEETGGKYDFQKPVTIDGVTHTIPEWGKIKGLSKQAIYKRINEGMSPEEAVTLPARNEKNEQGAQKNGS